MDTAHQYREVTVTEYVRYLLGQWRLIAIAALVAAAVAALYSVLLVGQRYAATSSIIATGELSAPPTNLEQIAQGLNLDLSPTTVRPEVELCAAILRSRGVRQQLVAEYKLTDVWGLISEQDALQALEEKTDVQAHRPNVVQIKVELCGLPVAFAREPQNTSTRQLSADLANGYIRALQDKLGDLHLFAAKRKRIFLGKKKTESRAKLQQAEHALQQWESENKLIDAQEAGKLAGQEIVQLQQKQVQAQLEFASVKEEIAKAEQLLSDQPPLQIASLEQEANPLLIQLREKLVQLEADLATAIDIKGETQFHPEVQELRQQLTATRRALAEQQQQQMFIARKVETHNPAVVTLIEQLLPLQIKKEALRAKIQGLKHALTEAEEQVTGLSADAMEYGRLLREVGVREIMYQQLITDYEQALIAEQGEEPQVYVLDEAVLPEQPISPRLGTNVALAAFAGLIISVLGLLSRRGL